MNLLNKDKSIRCIKFKCLLTNEIFEVVGTTSTLGDLPYHRDNVSRTKDKVKRLSDEVNKIFTRLELEKRFTNIEIMK